MLIILFMVVMSVYGYIALPEDFEILWLDTTGIRGSEWYKNPKTAQPSWTKYLGMKAAPTNIYEDLRPTQEGIVIKLTDFYVLLPELKTTNLLGSARPSIGYYQVYEVRYDLEHPVSPQDILVEFSPRATKNETILVYVKVFAFLIRPDNVTLKILEKTTNTQSRLIEKIDCWSYVNEYISFFKLNVSAGSLCALNPAFMVPAKEGSGYEVVTGRYRLKLALVYLGDPVQIESLLREGTTGFDVEIRILGTSYGLLGTDVYGRDLYQGLLYGFHIALLIGLFAATATVILGTLLGLVSGYFGGVLDEIVQRLADLIGNVPLLPILILLGVALQTAGYSGYIILFAIIVFLVIFGWGGTAIMVRSMTLSIKSETYIDAARAVGASSFRIITRHILPQVLPYVVAVLVFSVPSAIIAEAGLSVLGVRHDLPTWGQMLSDALKNRDVAFKAWWWILAPGFMLGLFSFAFVALGYAIESIVDPRLRR
ncbi:MAG: ABC transporter permease [Acidilobaceae archaeon]